RPSVEPGRSAREYLDSEGATLQVGPVDVGDLVLAPGRRADLVGDRDHVVVVEVQARHGVVASGLVRFLLDRQRAAVRSELDDAVGLWVRDVVGEDHTAVDLSEGTQLNTQTRAEEDVVAENESDRV